MPEQTIPRGPGDFPLEHTGHYQAGDPSTGEHWTVAQSYDAFGVVRASNAADGWLSGEPLMALRLMTAEQALADPAYAYRIDWARRYQATNPEAAEYVRTYDQRAAAESDPRGAADR